MAHRPGGLLHKLAMTALSLIAGHSTTPAPKAVEIVVDRALNHQLIPGSTVTIRDNSIKNTKMIHTARTTIVLREAFAFLRVVTAM
jgi:hypothetical protein